MTTMLLSEQDGYMPPMHASWYAPLNTLDMTRMPAKFYFKPLKVATNGRALVIKDYPTAGKELIIDTRNWAFPSVHRQALWSLYPSLYTGIQILPNPNITPVPVSPPAPLPTTFP